MKAVLISIRPKWCEKIVNGEKTIEVRKSRPKLETPFKCYIYCTKAKEHLLTILKDGDENYGEIYHGKPVFIKVDESTVCDMWGKRQKVIGEFVCDEIKYFDFEESEWAYSVAPPGSDMPMHESEALKLCCKDGCLNDNDMLSYFGDEAWKAYFWHISNLKIYDKPLELSKFRVEDKAAIKACKHRFRAGQPEYVARHGGWLQGGWGCMKTGEPEWCENCLTKPLTRPPQSWCYVYENN